jgi:hypothetical protein
MKRASRTALPKSVERVLTALALAETGGQATGLAARSVAAQDASALLAAGLMARDSEGRFVLTDSGRAFWARSESERAGLPVDKFRAQHLGLASRTIATAQGAQAVIVDDAESPLAWLARRKGRDGKSHLQPVHLQAGERLRADFTRAQLMPRVTANWTATVAQGPRGGAPTTFSDLVIAARQCVRRALDAAGPEFAGLLVDVCCFLKRLEDVERERGWPPRSAKVVLQLGLERLARHYGLETETRGRAHASVRTWLAPDAQFVVGEG